MDLSGIIFVALAVAWAGYLIPKALKHHDEVARTRSIDRFSTAMRVLAHREPVSRRDARLVVSPARRADNPRMLVPDAAARAIRPETPVRRPDVRAAARAAARRRRRILSFLLLAAVVIGGLAAAHVVPIWAPAVPVLLVVGYLVLCRTQVRHQAYAEWERELDAPAYDEDAEVAPRRAVRVEAQDGTPRVAVRNEQGFEEVDPLEDTVSMPAVVDAVAVPTADGGSLWDPLPVTLPTYV
ncbi:MAG: divisome protein SepX/GlpR, partial [Nocardioidaceae bacterium]